MAILDRVVVDRDQFSMSYKGATYACEYDGRAYVMTDGTAYSTLSAAGEAIRGSAVNGWAVWSRVGASVVSVEAFAASRPAKGAGTPRTSGTAERAPKASKVDVDGLALSIETFGGTATIGQMKAMIAAVEQAERERVAAEREQATMVREIERLTRANDALARAQAKLDKIADKRTSASLMSQADYAYLAIRRFRGKSDARAITLSPDQGGVQEGAYRWFCVSCMEAFRTSDTPIADGKGGFDAPDTMVCPGGHSVWGRTVSEQATADALALAADDVDDSEQAEDTIADSTDLEDDTPLPFTVEVASFTPSGDLGGRRSRKAHHALARANQ